MTDHTPPTGQQLNDIETVIDAYQQHPDLGFACCSAHPAADAATALLAEVHRLRARVTELEGPAVEARAALAALCYDLEDPGSNALGALYLISQATVGVDAPKDDATLALGQHAAQVLHRVADMADPEPPEVSFFGPTFGPQIAAWLRMLADQPKSVETTPAP